MEISGASSASSTNSNISFGSITKSLAAAAVSKPEDQLTYLYREVVKLRQALEPVEDKMRLRTEDDVKVMSKAKAEKIADFMENSAEALNNLFDNKKIKAFSNSDIKELVENIRDDLQTAIAAGFGSDSTTLTTDFGIKFDFSPTATHIFDFTSLDRNELVRKLTSDGDPVKELFFGRKSNKEDGLIDKMLNFLGSTETILKDILGTAGIFVDKLA